MRANARVKLYSFSSFTLSSVDAEDNRDYCIYVTMFFISYLFIYMYVLGLEDITLCNHPMTALLRPAQA